MAASWDRALAVAGSEHTEAAKSAPPFKSQPLTTLDALDALSRSAWWK